MLCGDMIPTPEIAGLGNSVGSKVGVWGEGFTSRAYYILGAWEAGGGKGREGKIWSQVVISVMRTYTVGMNRLDL